MKPWWGVAWPISLGVLIGLLVAGFMMLVSSSPRGEAIRILPPPSPQPLSVYVSGAVARPGVYSLPQGSRVLDAIRAAGEALPDADLESLNLAAPLEDGVQVEMPIIGAAETSQATPGASRFAPGGATGGLVNINTAAQEELEGLPGIGPTLAQRIIDYRQANGPFASIEAIQDVEGIGPGIFEEIKELITVR